MQVPRVRLANPSRWTGGGFGTVQSTRGEELPSCRVLPRRLPVELSNPAKQGCVIGLAIR